MLLTLLPTTVLAAEEDLTEERVAYAFGENNVSYAVKNGVGTVSLTDNVTKGYITFPNGTSVNHYVLDLNEKKIETTLDNETVSIVVNDGAELTIRGNGGITASRTYLNVNGKVTIENGTFTGHLVADGTGILTIKGGTFRGVTKNGYSDTAIEISCKETLIEGGSFTGSDSGTGDNGSNGYGLEFCGATGTSLTIENGTFTGGKGREAGEKYAPPIFLTGARGNINETNIGRVTIKNGTFTGGAITNYALGTDLTIMGGTFANHGQPAENVGGGESALAPLALDLAKQGKVKIQGGTFKGFYGLYLYASNTDEEGTGTPLTYSIDNTSFATTAERKRVRTSDNNTLDAGRSVVIDAYLKNVTIQTFLRDNQAATTTAIGGVTVSDKVLPLLTMQELYAPVTFGGAEAPAYGKVICSGVGASSDSDVFATGTENGVEVVVPLADVELTYGVYHSDSNDKLILDLNGHTLTRVDGDTSNGESNDGAFYRGRGELTIRDSAGGGELNGGTITASYISSLVNVTGTLKLESGVLTAGSRSGEGNVTGNHAVYISGAGAAFEMSGGTLTGGKASEGATATGGSAVEAYEAARVIVTGGTLTGGGADTSGRATGGKAITADKVAKLTVSGSTLTGGAASTTSTTEEAGAGSALYFDFGGRTDGAVVELSNATLTGGAASAASAKAYGGESVRLDGNSQAAVTLTNVTAKGGAVDENSLGYGGAALEISLKNAASSVSVTGGTYTGGAGKAIGNDGTIETNKGMALQMNSELPTVTINGGQFTGDTSIAKLKNVEADNLKFRINAGQFDSVYGVTHDKLRVIAGSNQLTINGKPYNEYIQDANISKRTFHNNVVVTKADALITKAPTASEITCGQKLSQSTLSGGTASAAGTFAWRSPETVPEKSGSYEVVFIAGDGRTESCFVFVTVNKADGSGKISVGNITYGDALSVTAESVTNGTENVTYTYKVKGANDRTYTNAPPTDVGEYTVRAVFAATEQYAQVTVTADFKISPKTLTADNVTIDGVENSYTYTGTEIKPAPSAVKYGEKTLIDGTDYTLSYRNNKAAGNATLVVSFCGNYTGIVEKTFTITEKPAQTVSFTDVSDGKVEKTYGDPSFTHTATTNGDGAITYGSSATTVATVNESTGEVTIVGAGEAVITATAAETNNHAAGSAHYTLVVAKQEVNVLQSPTATAITYGQTLDESTLSGGSVSPIGTGSTIAGSFAWKDATIKPTVADSGKEKYEVIFTPESTNYASVGSEVAITVAPKNFSDNSIVLSVNSGCVFGQPIAPDYIVKDGETVLTKETDYTEQLTGIEKAGTARITITGTGNYTGTKNTTFAIEKATITGDAVTLSASELRYNRMEQRPDVTVKVGTATLVLGTDYHCEVTNNRNVGTATVKVTGMNNYQSEVTKTFAITPAPLTIQNVTIKAKNYDGTVDAEVDAVTFDGLLEGESVDYTAGNVKFNSQNVEDANTVTGTITLNEDVTNYTLADGSFTSEAHITKADQTKPILTISDTQAVIGLKVPTLTVTGGAGNGKYVYSSSNAGVAAVDDEGKLEIKAAGTTEIAVKRLGDDNYNESAVSEKVELTVLNRVELTVSDTKATDEALKAHLKNQGAITVGTVTREGESNSFSVAVKGNHTLTSYASSEEAQGTHAWIGLLIGGFKVNGGSTAMLTTLQYSLNGKEYTQLTEADQMDSAAVGGDGTEMVLWIKTDTSSALKIYLKDASGNEAVLAIEFTAYTAPSPGGNTGGGGSGSTGGSTTTKTEATTNPDGSTIKTETKSDGTVIETTTNPDGSTSKTESKTTTKSNGSTVETVTETNTGADGSKSTSKTETTTAKDGSKTETKSETKTEADGTKSETKSETKTDANGVTSGTETTKTTAPNGSTGTTTTTTENGNTKTEAEAKVSEKAIEDAKKSGEAVKVPIEVKAGENSDSAPTVKVELPKNAGETKIEIPVSDVNSGTVAVIVHPDGTEELVKNSKPTEDGVQLTVDGSATVKIIDNSKDFIDTRNHWSRDEVNFVTSREIFNGVGGNDFGVDQPMTRGMVNTVLARLAGIDTTPENGQKWYEVGTAWAKANGISDGTNPEASVTREQLATLLYRFSGMPEVNGDLLFNDAHEISNYAQSALLWATQNGIMNGVGNERIAPSADAQRAQVAAMMARYLKNVG